MEDKRLLDYMKPAERYSEEEVSPDIVARQESQGFRNQRMALAGATPLLVGLLAGNMGDAYDVAGKALIDEDQRQLKEDGSLMSYLRKKQMARDTAAAKASSVDPLGKQQKVKLESGKLASFSPITGKVYNPTTGEEIPDAGFYRETPEIVGAKTTARESAKINLGAKGRSIGVDPEGYMILKDSVKGTVKRIGNLSKIPSKKRDRIIKQVDTFDRLSKKQREGLESAEAFMDAIKIGNPISDQYAIFTLAKTADNGGRLSDQDVERFGGSKALDARVAQALSNARKGTFTEENRKFMIEIAEAMIKTNRRQLSAKARRFSNKRSKLVGEDLYQYLDQGGSLGSESPKENKPLKRVVQDGNIFEQQADGSYKHIGKE